MLAEVEKELNGWLKEIWDAILDDFSHQAADFRRRAVLSQGSAENNLEMVLNWAFLVPPSAVANLRARTNRANANHAQQGLVFELSGPWPPYSFSPSLGMAPGG